MSQYVKVDYQDLPNNYQFVQIARDQKTVMTILSGSVKLLVGRDKVNKMNLLYIEALKAFPEIKKYFKVFYVAKVNDDVGILEMPFDLVNQCSKEMIDRKKKNLSSDKKDYTFLIAPFPEPNGYTSYALEDVKETKKLSEEEIKSMTDDLAEIIEKVALIFKENTDKYISSRTQKDETINPDDVPFQ